MAGLIDHVVCKHVVESAERFGKHGGIRGGGGGSCGRGVESIGVGCGYARGCGEGSNRQRLKAKWKLAISLM